MDRRILTLAILVLITMGSICALSVYRDDARSEVTALTPYSIIDYSASGTLDIGGELHPYVIADATFGVDLVDGGRSHCWVALSFSRSSFGPNNNLEFEFWTMEGSQAPEGSVRVSTAGNESRYIYDDPLTGTELTFRLVDGRVDGIAFRGTTVNEFNGDLEYVSFDIEASFDSDPVFVNRVIESPLPEPVTLRISGVEDGRSMSGTLTVTPLSSIVWDGGNRRTVASVTLDIPGSSLPDSLTDVIVELSDGYGFIEQVMRVQYLDDRGVYVDQDVVYRLSGADGLALVLEGTITSSVLDTECEVIEQNVLGFSYGVVR